VRYCPNEPGSPTLEVTRPRRRPGYRRWRVGLEREWAKSNDWRLYRTPRGLQVTLGVDPDWPPPVFHKDREQAISDFLSVFAAWNLARSGEG
jgi:hypothetical protein